MVVGAGYIGLEAAAVGAQLGMKVTVLEAMPQVLSRVAGPEIGAFYTRIHREAGTDVRLGARIEGFEGVGSVSGVRLADGEIVPADFVLVGVGVLPNMELALEAGLTCGNGIVVDAADADKPSGRVRGGRRRLAAAGPLRPGRAAGVGPQRHRGRQAGRGGHTGRRRRPRSRRPGSGRTSSTSSCRRPGCGPGRTKPWCAETPEHVLSRYFTLRKAG